VSGDDGEGGGRVDAGADPAKELPDEREDHEHRRVLHEVQQSQTHNRHDLLMLKEEEALQS